MIDILSLIVALTSLIVAYIIYYNNSIGDVVVYAKVDLTRPTMINLVIHNIGKGVARDINFISPTGIPEKSYGIEGLTQPKKIYESGALVDGLTILLPDEKLVYSWGQFGGLKEALNNKPLEITITFYSRTALQIFKRKIVNKVIVNPMEFSGVNISEPSFQTEIKKSLREISSSLKKFPNKKGYTSF